MPDTTLAPGTRFAGYTIEQPLGRGAFGAVYRAFARDGARVALKVIDGRGHPERLFVEPEILARFRHPNIVQLRDYFVERGSLVLAMEYIEGPTLEAYLRERGRLSENEVLELIAQIAQALEHAHRHNVLHRDIKTSNILVDLSGSAPRFVLADFGVAQIAEGVQLHRRIGGTYHFMAPEQLRGRASMQSDLWALGVVAYVALSSKLPFEGKTLEELTRNVLYETPTPPSRLGGSISAEIDDLVLRLLEKQLENRTASAAKLLAKLGQAVAVVETEASGGVSRTTWQVETEAEIRRCTILGVISALVAGVPSGVVGTALALVACNALLWAYRRQPSRLVIFFLPLVLSQLSFACHFIESLLIGAVFREKVFSVLGLVWGVATIPFPAHFLFKAVRLKRELMLVTSVREHAGRPDALLHALERIMQDHPDDVTIQVRYVEALLAAGQPRDAAVEAKLVLVDDPYNFGAALHLAHAYFDLGLYELCTQTCDEHLHVTPYAFELADLRQRAYQLAS